LEENWCCEGDWGFEVRMEGWVLEGMKTVFVFVVRTVMLMVFFSVTTLFMPCDTPTAIVFVEIGCESVIMSQTAKLTL
jgi:hypothetical protein